MFFNAQNIAREAELAAFGAPRPPPVPLQPPHLQMMQPVLYSAPAPAPYRAPSLYGAFRAVFINLDTRHDRRASIETNLRNVGMSALRFGALQGKDVAEALVTSTWDSTINAQFDAKTLPARLQMSPGERGCAKPFVSVDINWCFAYMRGGPRVIRRGDAPAVMATGGAGSLTC